VAPRFNGVGQAEQAGQLAERMIGSEVQLPGKMVIVQLGAEVGESVASVRGAGDKSQTRQIAQQLGDSCLGRGCLRGDLARGARS